MNDDDKRWMAYIDAEVSAVCDSNGWNHQIRRKWSAREKPVSHSTIDDYEWKLILDGQVECLEAEPKEFDEGVYFVLRLDSGSQKFILQHDTFHCGEFGDHWATCTYTEIDVFRPDKIPTEGWLRRLLLDLTKRFKPNQFSVT